MPSRGSPGRPKRPAPSGRARPEKLATGRYSIQVSLGTGPDGTRRRERVTGDTPEAARAARDDLLARHKAGTLAATPAAGRETVASLLHSWLENKRGTVEPSTWHRYRLLVERHIIPRIGRLRIGELRPDDLRSLYRALGAPSGAKKGLSPRSVEYVHVTIAQALTQATRDGLVGRNVAEAVDPPKVPWREMRALTPAEVDALLTTAEGDWRTLWMLALYTGCREGELLGLTWPDVDLERATVTVQRALVAGEDGVTLWVRPFPKSRAGIRIIPITAEVVAELHQHRRRQVEERLRAAVWAETDHCVFLTTRGTPLNPSHVSRSLKRDALAAGITGNVHPHLLRHTFASTLLAAGRPIPEVSYLLGHASAALTLSVYSHYVRGAGEGSAEALRRFYGGF